MIHWADILVFFGALLNAQMDVGMFRKTKMVLPKWWGFNPEAKYVGGITANGRAKWYGIPVPVQLTDGWHFCKMLLLVCLFFFALIRPYSSFLPVAGNLNSLVSLFLTLGYLGYVWSLAFKIGFNWLLVKEKTKFIYLFIPFK